MSMRVGTKDPGASADVQAAELKAKAEKSARAETTRDARRSEEPSVLNHVRGEHIATSKAHAAADTATAEHLAKAAADHIARHSERALAAQSNLPRDRAMALLEGG